jgi:cation-transporting ATPase 13A3/4/5
MGYKKVSNNDVEHYTRKDSECELTFMGLIVFINRLKHDTAEVLARLKACEYKVKMISGDNSLTCAQTAKNASIVS